MNARLAVLLVSISLVFSLPITPCASADPAKVTGVFYLKVRSAPDFEAEETGVLAAGDVIDVIGEVGRWANIALEDGTTGYVSRKYLSPLAATAPGKGQPDGLTEDARERAADEADAADQVEPIGARTTAGSSENPPPPPEEPQPIRTDQPPQRARPLCTSADLERLRRELGKLAAAQSRLAELMAAGAREEPAGRNWSSSISTRQTLFWLGAGCVIGWVAAVGLRHRRERRQRSRIRI